MAVQSKKVALVTGTAGFIGFHLARRLLKEGWNVAGIDGMTSYYDVSLKRARNQILKTSEGYSFSEIMLEDDQAVARVFDDCEPDLVVHLAAQAGVRYSLENPRAYIDANLIGTFNIMEGVRRHSPAHFLFASTSSVYGGNVSMPFGENDQADHALTLYAASKKATEEMAHSYSHLWQLPTTALRFFTVFGPWGRPDMALFKFVKAALEGVPIEVYGEGDMARDFTFIDDLVEAIIRLSQVPPIAGERIGAIDSLSPAAPFRVVNIGGGKPIGLIPFIETMEHALGLSAKKTILPMQKGDVRATFAKADLLQQLIGYVPDTPVEIGVERFVQWYREYYKVPV